MSEPTLEELREKAERSKAQYEKDNKARNDRAVAEYVKSPEKWSHLARTAERAGIKDPYLRELVERAHPGLLQEASAKRKAEREARKAGKGKKGQAAA